MSSSTASAHRAPSFATVLAWMSLAIGSLTVAYTSTLTTEGQQRLEEARTLYSESPAMAFLSTGPRMDVAEVLYEVERMRPQPVDPAIEQRLAALETAIGPFTGSIAPQSERGFVPDAAAGFARTPADMAQPVDDSAMAPPGDWPPLEVTDDADQPDVSIQTTEFAVDLAGAQSLAGSITLWQTLTADHPDLLGNFQPAVIARDTAEGGLDLRLIAGPIRNAADAAALCAKLKDQGLACALAVYNGQKLAMR